MRKFAVFCFSGVFAIASGIVFIIRSKLLLSEYSQTGFSELVYYSPLTAVLMLCIFLTTATFALGILLHIKPLVVSKKKLLTIVCSIVLVIALGITAINIGFSVASADVIERSKIIFDFVEEQPNEEIPAEYEFLLPFMDKINDYYSFKSISTTQAEYIHAQNYTAHNGAMIVYDVEYFEADRLSLTRQYIFQKTEPKIADGNHYKVLYGIEKSIDGVNCIVYSSENYLQIRIIDKYSCYSIVFDNLYDICESDTAGFEKLAIDIYSRITNQ